MKNYIVVIAIIVLLVFALRYRRRIRRFFSLFMSKYDYFTFSEFDSPGEPGSGEKYMDRTFIRRLDRARKKAGIPFVIVSGARTISHNRSKAVGGVPGSSHEIDVNCNKCVNGADIDYTTIEQRDKILKALVNVGFNRFGIRTGASGSSIHVDSDETKSQFAVWGYKDKFGNYIAPGVDPFSLA